MNDDLFREKVKAVVTLYNTDLEIDLLDELILLRSIFVKEGNINQTTRCIPLRCTVHNALCTSSGQCELSS